MSVLLGVVLTLALPVIILMTLLRGAEFVAKLSGSKDPEGVSLDFLSVLIGVGFAVGLIGPPLALISWLIWSAIA